jgi:hypothetical protein
VVLTIKADIDQETYERLVGRAVHQRRSIPDQAGVELRRAFGLPLQYETVESKTVTLDPRGPGAAA